MWTTVLVLAIAVNFEPTRIGLVPLMLVRPRPLLQLFAFLCGCLTMTFSVGLLVLFVFHKSPLGTDKSNGAVIQIVVGAIALVVAAVLASNLTLRRNSGDPVPSATITDAAGAAEPAPRAIDRMSTMVKSILQKGNSPWFAALVGLGVGLPSVDYMAILIVIGASGAAPLAQAAALVTFLVIGHAVVAIPLVSYLVAPARTSDAVARFQTWIQARTRREFAVLLTIIGLIMVGIGIRGL